MPLLTYPEFTPHFKRQDWVLPTVLEQQATTRPDSPCLSWTDTGPAHSFAEVNAIANRLARGFAKRGVARGDFVVLFLPNCLEYVFAWFALAKLGAIEVTVGDGYKGSFLQHQAGLSKARLIVTTTQLLPQLVEVETGLADLGYCILIDAAQHTADAAAQFKRIGISDFADLYDDDASNLGIQVSPEDVAAVLFTSGTTGLSKGVVMPHSQFYFYAEEDVQLVGLLPQDVYMTAFPLFHGNAQFLTVYPSLIAGAHCVLYSRFNASDFIGRARRSGATVCNLVGSTLAFICAQPPQADDKDHQLRCIYAAPLSPDLADVFYERFGKVEFVDGFGQTEISNIFMTPRGAIRPPGASGVLMDQWFEVRIADPETDAALPEGQVGELLVRPKFPGTLSNGYLGMPEKTLEAWRNLWFHTGDALRCDAQGWYYFVDRVKDSLRRRGENISSFEVEAVVRSHPAVAECGVVAVKEDERGGEDEVKACVVLNAGVTTTYEELVRWCDERMPSFMVPRFIEYFDALPQTPSQKIRKKELRERGVTATTWDRVSAGCLLQSERRRKSGPQTTATQKDRTP